MTPRQPGTLPPPWACPVCQAQAQVLPFKPDARENGISIMPVLQIRKLRFRKPTSPSCPRSHSRWIPAMVAYYHIPNYSTMVSMMLNPPRRDLHIHGCFLGTKLTFEGPDLAAATLWPGPGAQGLHSQLGPGRR